VRRNLIFQASGYVAASGSVAAITIFYQHAAVFKTTTIVLTYLLAIRIASTIWGLGVSLFMTAASTLACDYYFSPPVGILSIDDPQDWVALTSFFVTSVIGSELSARATPGARSQEATQRSGPSIRIQPALAERAESSGSIARYSFENRLEAIAQPSVRRS
jgi:K+-sensing histidine kinase KdpD